MQGVALEAGGVAAQSLLPALVACHALHLVVDAVAVAIIPVLEKLPAHALAQAHSGLEQAQICSSLECTGLQPPMQWS